MSHATEKPCAACAHVRYEARDAQHVCMHPDVTTPSVVTGKLIGTDADVVRYRPFLLGARRCGPSGLWWQAKAAEAAST